MTKKYRRDRKSKQSSLEAKFEAQKLAFAPISFQAAKALRDLGILEELYKAGEFGLSATEIADKLNLSNYGVETLLEVGVNINVINLKSDLNYCLTKTGLFIVNDEMTRINMDFVNDVCYQGSFFMQESIKNSKPEGLKVFGNWETIYQGLTALPQNVQKSWFAFDHFYSDAAFDEALKIVFAHNPQNLFDIGGNTGRWAVQCLQYNSSVKITILDLPGQLNVAKNNLEMLNLAHRVNFHETNILNQNALFPKGADAVWMSQFLDCFSKEQITDILTKVAENVDENCKIYILEPFWDQQKFPAAKFSLNHTSLYFTCMANGNSKMYALEEMVDCAKKAGLKLEKNFNDIGENDYTLLQLSKK